MLSELVGLRESRMSCGHHSRRQTKDGHAAVAAYLMKHAGASALSSGGVDGFGVLEERAVGVVVLGAGDQDR